MTNQTSSTNGIILFAANFWDVLYRTFLHEVLTACHNVAETDSLRPFGNKRWEDLWLASRHLLRLMIM